MNLFSPAAITEFFEELADVEAVGSATPELLEEIAARCRLEVLGPVPDPASQDHHRPNICDCLDCKHHWVSRAGFGVPQQMPQARMPVKTIRM